MHRRTDRDRFGGHRFARWAAFATLLALPAAHAASNAEIVSLEGKGEYREAQASSWRPAALKQPLFPSNFVRTGDLSRMAILFPDRTQVRLAQNSVLQIKEAAAGKDARTILHLNSGRSWVQSKTAPGGLTMETPTATAAIRGTDWEMAVAPDGTSTLSVFSGEVEFSNAHGGVIVGVNEQAVAEKGRAPVKLALRTSRARVQWVSSETVEPGRHAELRGTGTEPAQARRAAAMIAEGRLADAYAVLVEAARPQPREPVAQLMLADFEVYRGDLDAAQRALEAGARAFPGDVRFAARLARVALHRDDRDGALALARRATGADPASVEAWVALGDVERLQGNPRDAAIAYGRAIELAPDDARGHHGLGVIESERENVGRGRALLRRAMSLDAAHAAYPAELGTLETFAGDLAAARASLERSVALQPDHYVAWTGLGILALKEGRVDAAVEALLRATLIEPRYARAHLYLAAAHYEQARGDAALASLRRASEADPLDPLPHLLSGIIHLDRIEPGLAAAEARQALRRIPFLRSANQVADNQKGVANVGTALAMLGLESWARSMAHESYLPSWGASHLFLADRYPGEFNRRSELMQGFVINPAAFGASNRFQSLVTTPGHYGTASVRFASSDDVRAFEPTLTLNGYVAAPFATAYFVEAMDTIIQPRNAALDARGRTLTAAVGLRPTHELSAFLYVNRLAVDADIGTAGQTGVLQQVSGVASRVDVGARYAPTPDASVWIKAAAGREDADVRETTTVRLPELALKRLTVFDTQPAARELAVRATLPGPAGIELTLGAESARTETPKFLQRDASLHFEALPAPQESLLQEEIDRSTTIHASGRWKADSMSLEAGVARHDYRKDRDFLVRNPQATELGERHRRKGVDAAFGASGRPWAPLMLRGACRRWLRPVALDTLAPVAVAGIPLDDQMVLAGGTLRQCHAQAEWTVTPSLFATVDAGELRTRNVLSPLDGVLNSGADVTNLDRLRNRTITQPGKPDQLEDTPVYAEGRLRRGHVAVEALVTQRLSARLHYTYSDGINTDDTTRGLRIPYVARHAVNGGITWSPGHRVFVTAVAAWRSRRFADEANGQPLPAGWDMQASFFIESADKRWALEAYAANLLKKEVSDAFGLLVSYRF
ncbi:MAG TPA: tetratricopeptide repeat protein [Usitatibacter sp.]|nr:tetratricopeptide repeat protein [Usitatibacter sp.]